MFTIRRFYIFILSIASLSLCSADELKSGEFTVTQTWSQETDYKRIYYVNVPESKKPLPFLIFLHGNGGNAEGAKRHFLRRHPKVSAQYITVFPQGYKASWNIVSERSSAPDLEFIETIATQLSKHSNVKKTGAAIVGSSNGAALVNQIAIETRLENFSHYVTMVSPLNGYQHDGKGFKAKGADNNYTKTITPLKGKHLMNISGTDDRLIPYAGGMSAGIRAKNSKLTFLAAEQSTYLWAKQYGYQGKPLSQATKSDAKFDTFSYLNGAVIHYKVKNEAHGAGRVLTDTMLLEFLNNTN